MKSKILDAIAGWGVVNMYLAFGYLIWSLIRKVAEMWPYAAAIFIAMAAIGALILFFAWCWCRIEDRHNQDR